MGGEEGKAREKVREKKGRERREGLPPFGNPKYAHTRIRFIM